jgi:hypothetical protein
MRPSRWIGVAKGRALGLDAVDHVAHLLPILSPFRLRTAAPHAAQPAARRPRDLAGDAGWIIIGFLCGPLGTLQGDRSGKDGEHSNDGIKFHDPLQSIGSE